MTDNHPLRRYVPKHARPPNARTCQSVLVPKKGAMVETGVERLRQGHTGSENKHDLPSAITWHLIESELNHFNRRHGSEGHAANEDVQARG